MQTFKHTLGALALAALALTGTAQAQTVNNGSFTSGLGGWTNGPVTGFPGAQLATWSGFGGVAVFDRAADRLAQEIFNFVGGQSYQLSFDYTSSNPTTNANGLRFDFAGTAYTYNPGLLSVGGTGGNVVNHVYTFQAVATGSTVLSFRGATGSVASLDNVSITAVPEPETYAMLLAGLGAIGFMSRRRKNLES